jgi:hypothetical protein
VFCQSFKNCVSPLGVSPLSNTLNFDYLIVVLVVVEEVLLKTWMSGNEDGNTLSLERVPRKSELNFTHSTTAQLPEKKLT